MMDIDDRHRRYEAARLRGELTVQELWLRYLALGGTGDEFDIDGYLQGLLPWHRFQLTILAVALNERLDEILQAARIPTPIPDGADYDDLRRVIRAWISQDSPDPPGRDEAD
jgi:hypothetical protein